MTALYDDNFHSSHRDVSNWSAQVVIPMIQELVEPKSVLDVGCGIGSWASVWHSRGVDVTGVDGEYVNQDLLEIPRDRFIPHDLAAPLNLGRKFDLVTSFEVAEHLPDTSAESFVQSLIRHSTGVIVFSAAVPKQGGTGHINEQWPSYWARFFENNGYRAYDPFRAKIWHNNQVAWWYRQNILIFAEAGHSIEAKLPALSGPLDVVHPALFSMWAGG